MKEAARADEHGVISHAATMTKVQDGVNENSLGEHPVLEVKKDLASNSWLSEQKAIIDKSLKEDPVLKLRRPVPVAALVQQEASTQKARNPEDPYEEDEQQLMDKFDEQFGGVPR